MKVEVYNWYSKNRYSLPEISPSNVYGNCPYVINTRDATCTVYLNGEPVPIKYWTYEETVSSLRLYEYATADDFMKYHKEEYEE